jgi:hypothetical protein
MKKLFLKGLLATGVMAYACGVMAATSTFSFGVIPHPFKAAQDDSILRQSIADTDSENLAFVVANGIKARTESCNDNVYNGRKALLGSAENGLIVSLAASDWTDCKSRNGRSTAIARLNRLRELFFADEMSLGATRIPLARQSAIPKFRSYGENARWEFGNAMFASINLPENNNHYLSDAGRNGEFEDRLLANRDWLNRVFTYARLKKMSGIVLFCDGNPLSKAGVARRDGFAEVRQQITTLAAKFPGKVLIVHDQPEAGPSSSNEIKWRNNVGVLEAGSPWTKVRVDPSLPVLFAITGTPSLEAKNAPAADATVR